jgi:hypothetical protein
VYVEDLADGVVRGLAAGAANRVYNLVGTETTTILEIAEAVRDLVGDAEIVHTPARAGDFGGKEVSSDRALEELGWRPVTPFREGARRYVEWRRAREEVPAGAVASNGHAPVPAGAVASNGGVAVAPPRKRRLAPLGRVAAAWLVIPRRLRPAVSGALISAVFFWSFASDDGLAVFAWAFPGAKPVSAVETSAPEVGLIIDAPPAAAADIARALRREGASATIALTGPAPKATVDTVHAAGSEVMPRLKPGGPVRWIGTRGQLRKTARSLGIHGHFYYAAPGKGFTLAQEFLGRTTGATPVSGAVKLRAGDEPGSLDRGDLLEISLGSGGSWHPWLDSVVAGLRVRGLRATSAVDLVRAKPDEH